MPRKSFDEQLADLKSDVLEMANLAQQMFIDGVRSLVDLDEELAEEVLSRKDELADMDYDIEEEALQLVARQQPMARDLRAIGAALKLITYINRIGRYGKDIAQITTQLSGDRHAHELVQLPEMAEHVVKMMATVMASYEDETEFDIDQILEWEDDLDAKRWSVFRECLTYMMEDPQTIEANAYYMMIARYLERCGDNVCKMAEKTHYMVTGEHRVIK